ncbi:hypothetical protein ASF83_02110 [Plantibacter sp. Leaf171]|uniref:hypothetical protein n=1 Tax=unclassified Plantibacter TaxID=2624265 RepID=UPI0006F30064|nr:MULTISPECIES: hypothetical protein [unclassified Plantibacter]KQM17894.1 hypothetical protein ASE44_02125 [Plantibacter sp. Leaf1]KQR60675.1 hypothetical protein ASF83_02110 [Plantibacter sp. Leaf171]
MESPELLDAIRRIVEEDWSTNKLPVLLSKLPKRIDSLWPGEDYRGALGRKNLKGFLQENATVAGLRLVQDRAHSARVGLIPLNEEYEFPALPAAPPSGITPDDARAFARVIESMTAEEKQTVAFPASFVARLLAATR